VSKAPRIILWDIETSHNFAAVFQLKHNDYISADNIVQERVIICAAWKELGRAKVHAVSVADKRVFNGRLLEDRAVCAQLHAVLSSADIIVAHNGDEYDIKFTKGRMLVHGLPPLPPIVSIDTLKVARKQFLLNANNLDYLGKLLGVGGKKTTPKGLWLRVLQGDRKAIRDMVAYNKEDVRLLERVYLKLRQHTPDHPSRHLYGDVGCPRCGSLRIQSRGTHRAMSRAYARFQCQACGGWFRDMKPAAKGVQSRVL
jgi:predicted RNA-binding Zn-ribbon protein involved in translation (DUF1610 family)